MKNSRACRLLANNCGELRETKHSIKPLRLNIGPWDRLDQVHRIDRVIPTVLGTRAAEATIIASRVMSVTAINTSQAPRSDVPCVRHETISSRRFEILRRRSTHFRLMNGWPSESTSSGALVALPRKISARSETGCLDHLSGRPSVILTCSWPGKRKWTNHSR